MKHIIIIIVLFIGTIAFSQEIPEDNTVYHMLDIEKRPAYSQGRQVMTDFLVKNFRGDQVEEKTGRITTRLLIEKDGSVSNIEVLEDIGPKSRKEILRLFKELKQKWIPGEHNGKIVRSYFVHTITWRG